MVFGGRFVMNLTDFIVLALATWRLTSLLVWEAGPWDILARMRHHLGVRYDAESQRYSDRMLGRMLICPWCASVWCGAAMASLYLLTPRLSVWIGLPLAFSAAAVMIEKAVSHGES
jgi:hypothetical protein